MKAMIVTLIVIDFDNVGEDGVTQVIEHTRFQNNCIFPRVSKIETADIGEWHDDHPLNLKSIDGEGWIRNKITGEKE